VYYTLFNLPEIYLIACLIDYLSTVSTYIENRTAIKYGENILSFRAIFNDVRNSVERVHMKGKLKEMVCENIEKYIHKDDQLPVLLDRIRSHNAKTFLLTNSEYWYTEKLMGYLLTTTNNQTPKRDWKSYFNFILVDAQKPLFFAEGTTLRIIDPNTGSMKLGSYSGQLQQNEVYSGGSCEVFSKLIGSMGKDVLYVGDHIFGDIIKSKKQKAWRTMLVVPELNHELKVFHDKRDLFNTLEALDTSISELLRSFDMTSNQGPDAVTKIKQKIQQCTHELDMNFGLLGSLFRTGSRQTHFASQVTRFADIYASTVVNLVYYPFFYFFRAVPQLMPHESTVDPEEPMHFKSWGDEQTQSDTSDRRQWTTTNSINHSISMQTHPDLPRHVTHDHDDDGDPDDENSPKTENIN
jgi:5'-nucleotidase